MTTTWARPKPRRQSKPRAQSKSPTQSKLRARPKLPTQSKGTRQPRLLAQAKVPRQPKLRDYQVDAVQALRDVVRHGARDTYLSLPTGAGKTRILAAVAAGVVERGRRVLWVVHRKELVDQAASVLAGATGAGVGVVMAERHEPYEPTVVGSVQSLTPGRLGDLLTGSEPIGVLVVDECHHALKSNTYGRIVDAVREAYPEVVVMGATATPYRADRSRMADLLPVCAFERTIEAMIESGWLVPMRWHLTNIETLDLSNVRVGRYAGERDFAALDLARACVAPAAIAALVKETAPMLAGRRSVAFGASVEHATKLALSYEKAGLRTATVYGAMPARDRTKILGGWRFGAIDLVSNFGVLTEGYDLPELSAVVVARPTLSPGLYVQMIGRGLRPAPGKSDCLIVDTTGRGAVASGQPISLPDIVGEQAEGTDAVYGVGERPRRFLSDPSGRSRWAWGHDSETGAYVATVGVGIRAVIVRGHDDSGLYAPLVTVEKRLPQLCSDRLLPLREAVASVETSLARAGSLRLAAANMTWRSEEATERQTELLAKVDEVAAAKAVAEKWDRGEVSTAIDIAFVRPIIHAVGVGGSLSRLVGSLYPWPVTTITQRSTAS